MVVCGNDYIATYDNGWAIDPKLRARDGWLSGRRVVVAARMVCLV